MQLEKPAFSLKCPKILLSSMNSQIGSENVSPSSNRLHKCNRRIENLEFEVRRLADQLNEVRQLLQRSDSQTSTSQIPPRPQIDVVDPSNLPQQVYGSGSVFTPTPQSTTQLDSLTYFHPAPSSSEVDKNAASHDQRSSQLGSTPGEIPIQSLLEPHPATSMKRKRSNFEIQDGPVPDFIVKGLISREQAVLAFTT